MLGKVVGNETRHGPIAGDNGITGLTAEGTGAEDVHDDSML